MRRVFGALLVTSAAAFAACSVGAGTGDVTGSMYVPGCKTDLTHYDMQPNFFGAVYATSQAGASASQLLIRIQRGGDLTEFTDSLVIEVDDVDAVEAQIAAAGSAGATFDVGEYQRPPGSAPSVPPPLVRVVMSLRGSCGTPKFLPSDPANVAMEAVGGTVTFTSILHGDPNSRDVDSKRIAGSFDVTLADPRQTTSTPAASRLSGTLTGDFKFIYEAGGPAQPFP
jgi:hypothetical protein